MCHDHSRRPCTFIIDIILVIARRFFTLAGDLSAALLTPQRLYFFIRGYSIASLLASDRFHAFEQDDSQSVGDGAFPVAFSVNIDGRILVARTAGLRFPPPSPRIGQA
jgi:hypothetical protein